MTRSLTEEMSVSIKNECIRKKPTLLLNIASAVGAALSFPPLNPDVYASGFFIAIICSF